MFIDNIIWIIKNLIILFIIFINFNEIKKLNISIKIQIIIQLFELIIKFNIIIKLILFI